MKKLLTILILLPMLARAGKTSEVRAWFNWDDFTTHVIVSDSSDDRLTVKMKEWRGGYEFMQSEKVKFWTNYTWSTTNGNILVNPTNYPSITGGDSVKVLQNNTPGTGYRSIVFYGINCGYANPVDGQFIVIAFLGGYINPSNSHISANNFHGCKGVKVYNMQMNDHVDCAFVNFTSGGDYFSYVWFDHCSFRGTNGFFPYGGITTGAADYGGDSSHVFNHFWITNTIFDSTWHSQDGLCALWIGGENNGTFNNNNMWWDVVIANDTFAHYPSTTAPAMYVNLSTAFGVKIYNCWFYQLGMNEFSPVGHTQCIISMASLVWVWNNTFGPDNLGNDWRNKGCGEIYGVAQYSGDHGISFFVGNIIYRKRKYAVIESYRDPSDTSKVDYYNYRRSPLLANNTFIGAGIGTGGRTNDPWYTGFLDIYTGSVGGRDTVYIWNCIQAQLLDSTWSPNVYNVFTHETPTGTPALRDTGNNHWVQYAAYTGLQDSTDNFYPKKTSWLYGTGSALPYYVLEKVAKDKNGTPRPFSGRMDIGAVQYIDLPPSNQRVQYKYHKNISRKI